MHMWDPQVEALSAHFQILRYDRRGHGKSGVAPGEYTIGRTRQRRSGAVGCLRRQAKPLLRPVDWQHDRHVASASMPVPASTDLRFAASDRKSSLRMTGKRVLRQYKTLACPQWWMTPWTAGFPIGFQANSPETIEKIRGMYLATSLEGFVGCLHALRQADFTSDIGKITVPTLVIAGKDDPVCEVADLKKMADTVQQCSFTAIEGRQHLQPGIRKSV